MKEVFISNSICIFWTSQATKAWLFGTFYLMQLKHHKNGLSIGRVFIALPSLKNTLWCGVCLFKEHVPFFNQTSKHLYHRCASICTLFWARIMLGRSMFKAYFKLNLSDMWRLITYRLLEGLLLCKGLLWMLKNTVQMLSIISFNFGRALQPRARTYPPPFFPNYAASTLKERVLSSYPDCGFLRVFLSWTLWETGLLD